MIEMIEVLRDEHRNIEKLLRILDRELRIFDRGDRPDYELMQAIIDYFNHYPDSCHHPKEDLIVEKLKLRDPGAMATMGNLEAEHREQAARLRRVAQAIERVLGDEDLARQSVDNIMRDFVDREREHMTMEERLVFPVALNALYPEDWADIALKLADRYDPLSCPGLEEKFTLLRESILELEADAAVERDGRGYQVGS